MWCHISRLDSGLRVFLEIPDLLDDPGQLQVTLLLRLDLLLGLDRQIIEVRLDQVVSPTGSGFE
jgi:hypothetical protein